MAAGPIAVSLIASGRNSKSGQAVNEWRMRENITTTDFRLYDSLANPPQTAKVKKGEDYTEEETLSAVYGQEQFADVCIRACEGIISSQQSDIANGHAFFEPHVFQRALETQSRGLIGHIG